MLIQTNSKKPMNTAHVDVLDPVRKALAICETTVSFPHFGAMRDLLVECEGLRSQNARTAEQSISKDAKDIENIENIEDIEMAALRQDAARYQKVRRFVGGRRADSAGHGGFTLHYLLALKGSDLMRGGIAGHFDAAVDAVSLMSSDGSEPFESSNDAVAMQPLSTDWVKQKALEIADRHTIKGEIQRCAMLALDIAETFKLAHPTSRLEQCLHANYPDAKGQTIEDRVIDALKTMDIAIGMKDYAALKAPAVQPVLQSAVQAVLDRWDSPQWDWDKDGPTASLMHTLRAAIDQQASQKVETVREAMDVDVLAQEIRRVNGNNGMGAGALAEAIITFYTISSASKQAKQTADPLYHLRQYGDVTQTQMDQYAKTGDIAAPVARPDSVGEVELTNDEIIAIAGATKTAEPVLNGYIKNCCTVTMLCAIALAMVFSDKNAAVVSLFFVAAIAIQIAVYWRLWIARKKSIE